MRYLADLVKSLTQDEMDALFRLPLRGKEFDLLQWVCKNRSDQKIHNVAHVCASLNVTEKTLFKISSLLCDKIYECLVPTGGEDIIWWLLQRKLVPQLYHEMKQLEKKILPNSSRIKQVSFFSTCFEAAQKVPVRFYEEKRAKYYAGLLSKAAANKETDAYIQARLLSTTIYIQSAGVGLLKSARQLEKQFLKVEEFIRSTKKPCLKARYFLYRAYSLFYIDVEQDMAKSLAYLEQTMVLFKGSGNFFTEEERIITSCRVAETLYGMSRFKEAQLQYDDIFRKDGAHKVLSNDVYHHNKWAQLAMINGDLNLAGKILHKSLLPYFERKNPSISTMAAISLAKYHLLNREPEKADEYIQAALAFNKKDLYVQYEAELRYLHNTCFAMTGDKEFALDLVKKNMRYLRSKGLIHEGSNYEYYYHLLAAFLNNKNLTPELKAKLGLYNTGYYAVYGRLLSAIAAKYKYQFDQKA